MSEEQKQNVSTKHKVLTITGIVACVILIPILIMNCILLIKGYTNKDEVPSIGGLFPMIVLTDSMDGTFSAGSMIFCKSIDPEDIKEKDVITFYDPESTGSAVVTHRVIEIIKDGDKLSFRTQGDANNTADKTPVPAEDVLGKYTGFHIGGLGSIAMFMQTIPGLIVCVFIPLLLVIGYDVVRRNMYDKQHANDKDELLKELEELRKLKASQNEAQKEESVE